jgi:hypothetical protein
MPLVSSNENRDLEISAYAKLVVFSFDLFELLQRAQVGGVWFHWVNLWPGGPGNLPDIDVAARVGRETVLAMNRATGALELIEKTPVPGADKASPASLLMAEWSFVHTRLLAHHTPRSP